jgi:PAS domain S-box-containing protein
MASTSATTVSRALRVAEGDEQLRALVRASELPVLLVDLGSREILEASEALSALLNCRRDQLVRRDVTDFAVDEAMARSRLGLLATGALDSYRAHARSYRRCDGTQLDIDGYVTAYSDEAPRRLAIGVLLPATDQPVLLPTRPAASDPVVLGTVDEHGHIDRISAGVERLLGYRTAELIGRPIASLVHPSDWPSLLIAIGHALHGEGEATARVQLVGAEGEPRLCRALVSPLAGSGTPRFAFAVVPADALTPAIADRAWELEGHMRRIAREVAASGALAGLSATPTAATLPAMTGLTARELDIVSRLLAGERVPMIAGRLFLSASTVRNHLTSVYRKLGVRSQQELLALLRDAAPTE